MSDRFILSDTHTVRLTPAYPRCPCPWRAEASLEASQGSTSAVSHQAPSTKSSESLHRRGLLSRHPHGRAQESGLSYRFRTLLTEPPKDNRTAPLERVNTLCKECSWSGNPSRGQAHAFKIGVGIVSLASSIQFFSPTER